MGVGAAPSQQPAASSSKAGTGGKGTTAKGATPSAVTSDVANSVVAAPELLALTEEHSVGWVKVKGYPWWPVRLLSSQTHDPSASSCHCGTCT